LITIGIWGGEQLIEYRINRVNTDEKFWNFTD